MNRRMKNKRLVMDFWKSGMREQLFHRFSIPSIIFRNGHKEMEPQQHPDIHFEESLNDNMFFWEI